MSRQRKILAATVIIIALLSAGAYAYLASLPPRQGPRVVTLSSPLEFSMQLDKSEYLLGENVTITISMKNVGNDNITVIWPDYRAFYGTYWYFDFVVFDENDTKIDQWGDIYGLLAAVLTKKVGPGEQLTTVYTWMQKTGYPDFVQVPVGTYSVKGLSRPFGLKVGNQTMVSMELETPTITFTIT